MRETGQKNPFERLVRKLERLGDLEAADRKAIASLPFRISSARNGDYLVREGSTPTECCLLLEGYACRHKGTSKGGRQIVSFHLPGDLLDLQHLQLPKADHDVQTITDAVIAWISGDSLRQLMRDHPRINDALWRDALIDASIFREWVLNVGRRDARARIAHMLCEFAARREAAGLGSAERFELPMTQGQIADATGLTPVHVNRMLQALRADGLIAREGRDMLILDFARLKRVADFDATYLHAAA
jgi:CRP-like cAMP-binding protein